MGSSARLTGPMTRFFNTAGPCDPARHYMVPSETRLPEARPLIERLEYFVVHAPRQTGKTTTLRALARALTAEGEVAALHLSCEAAEVAEDDFELAQRALLDEIRACAGADLPEELWPPDPWPDASSAMLLDVALRAWAEACPRRLVLFLDEIDALRGNSLRSVLRQLRSGFAHRPARYPASVVLCGLRDVRDYKAAAGGDASRLGTSSPFNVKVASLRLGDFDEEEVHALLGQHQDETGQVIEEAARSRLFECTAGQPWLVNALARGAIEGSGVAGDQPITAALVDEAKERLILARETHLDSLAAKLREPRVRRILEPLLAGTLMGGEDSFSEDLDYTRDLGLVAQGRQVRVANPIYREVIARVLSEAAESSVTVEARDFVTAEGSLDMRRLLEGFAAFWCEHGEVLTGRMPYPEAAPQLVLMAYLQRVVNGGGYVDREYGVGRGRIDLCIRWPWTGADARRAWQREGLELKVWREGKADPLEQGLEQLDAYLERLGLEVGTLVVFDARPQAPPTPKRTRLEAARTPSGRQVTVLRG